MAENETSDQKEGEGIVPARNEEGSLSRVLGLLAALKSTPPSRATDAHEEMPLTTAAEFEQALRQLSEAGYIFDDSYPARLLSRKDVAADVEILTQMKDQHPLLPQEVAEAVFSELTGKPPSPEIIPPADAASKRQSVRKFVITETLTEKFYLRRCGKVPRYSDVDWEVVVKHVERGHSKSPQFPYALATIDIVNDVHGHHEHDTLTFAIGLTGLERLLSELSVLREHLATLNDSLRMKTEES